MKHIALVTAVMLFASSAFAAARLESLAYTCAGLNAAIAANGFAFLNSPQFQDFAVASGYYCSGDERVELRAVATADNPQCPVRHCASRPNFEAQ